MLLGSVTKHPSRSIADHISKSILCGRCGMVNYHPFKSVRLKAFGGWKVDRGTRQPQARILRAKGLQMKNSNRITVGTPSATFVPQVYTYTATSTYTNTCTCTYTNTSRIRMF